MDASKHKWRSIQKERQSQKNNPGNSVPVTEGFLTAPKNSNPSVLAADQALPKLDADTASRFRAPRPAVPQRAPHGRGIQQRRPAVMSEFVNTPVAPRQLAQPKAVAEVMSPQPSAAVAQPPAQPITMAQAVTRLAVASPEPVAAPVQQDVVVPNVVAPNDIVESGLANPPADDVAPPVIQMPHISEDQVPAPAPAEPEPPVVEALVAAEASEPPRQRLPGMDMELPGEESPDRAASALGRSRMQKFRFWAFRSTAAALALFIVGGGLLFSQGYLKMNKVFRGGTGTAAALRDKVDPNLLKGEGSGRINVLLLGRGGGAHDAPDLTDTLILASIDPVNHKTTLFSIPRDLWVNVPSAGNMKINAVYQTGVYNKLGKKIANSNDKQAVKAGFSLIDQTVEDVMGVNVDYNVMVDFAAFSQAVNTVGGIGVNVPADLVDPTMAWENQNDPVLAKAGPQQFDGKHALIYVTFPRNQQRLCTG